MGTVRTKDIVVLSDLPIPDLLIQGVIAVIDVSEEPELAELGVDLGGIFLL